jgi:acyl-CoA synthetase (AMP-forming)/AMP-acid ligase II
MFLTVLDHAEHRKISERPQVIRSAGTVVSDADVRIFDDEDREVPTGEIGEVVARAPHVMKGYWNRLDATAETLRNGWLHTGDVGRFDEEGYLYIVDRKKDMIISGGSNVYAREVEQSLLAMDAVKEVAVIGLPHPKWGEMVTAILVSRSGAPVRDDEMEKFCRANIADYRRPKKFIWVDSLPRNAYGKVLKRELRTRHAQKESQHV